MILIAFLLLPLLISGYILLTTLPNEKVRLSLYTGWSLYLRAATYGFFTLLIIAVTFSFLLPSIGKYIGSLSGIKILPDTDAISIISKTIESNIKINTESPNFSTYIYFTSLSIFSCALLLTLKLTSTHFPWLKKIITTSEINNVEKMFSKHSPLEYSLFIIGKNYQEDFKYNEEISNLREQAYKKYKNNNFTDTEIREIWKELKLKKLNFALVTLENDKFYIGRPILIPPPDEESIFSASIMLMPLMSGFRNKDKELVFTTEYDFDLIQSSPKDSVSFPADKIVTVSGFTFDNHNKFKKDRKKTKT